MKNVQKQFLEQGFAVVNAVFTSSEIENMLQIIAALDTEKETFRKTNDLFAIRQFLKEVPDIQQFVFNKNVVKLIEELFGEGFFATKSIYFDKPEQSNWFVAYHQDLTISVNKRMELEGFSPWTVKQNQFGVQAPLALLENNFTIRIHLDETNLENGALKVIPKSHLRGVCRPETINKTEEREEICEVKKGGIMLMRPLLLHASGRTTNHQKRRVIHIEFSSQQLPEDLEWSEKIVF